MNLIVLNCVVFQKLMGQDGSRDNRWVMTHGSYGSWVTSSMGHVGHGSLYDPFAALAQAIHRILIPMASFI